MNAVVTGGGTAGHVFPALAVAQELRGGHGASVTFVGSTGGQEARLVPAEGFPFIGLRVASAQTRLSASSLRALALAFRGSRACRDTVRDADVVVSIGGFASAPAVFAARRVRTPLILMEPNSVPGAVNRIAARWARVVCTTFAATRARLPAAVQVERTGNPVRPEIVSVPAERERLRVEARAAFDLEPGRTTVLVVGGSQGALRLDQVVAATLPALAARADLQLLVSTGPAHLDVVAEAIDPAAALIVRAVPFIDRMDRALAIADLVVSRAGASVAELAVCGLPAILVPYPHATEHHQDANAREVRDAGAARLLPEERLSPSTLREGILDLVDDPGTRDRMSVAARGWARPDAAARIATLAVEAAGRGR
jgi:UDP-N-acetylglucosamine--N-acetylmuramyl-(pentapeptide) pyrophosphoryl-undecaprenol N-acetylglucosamine transferase